MNFILMFEGVTVLKNEAIYPINVHSFYTLSISLYHEYWITAIECIGGKDYFCIGVNDW